ncbi:putative methionyl-tRNA synthetase [Hordeum vulgare]|nr:putative methionyl-tRNA synthetase [Hordeum vulgare]
MSPPRVATDSGQPNEKKLRNAQWKADIDCWAAVTTNRRNTLNMQKARDVAAEQEEASRAGMANLPPQHVGQCPQGVWGSQHRVASSANFSPPLWAVGGRPDGNKRAKGARDVAPDAKRLQSLIEQCITDAKSSPAKRKEKYEARWSALMTKQDLKLDLLTSNVATKKRNTDPTFLMGAYMSTMDEEVKAWYLVEHGLILN